MGVELLRDGAVAELVLDSPSRLNAFTHADQLRAIELLDAAAADAEVRALLVRGNGKAFCAGADLGFLAEIEAMPAAERPAAVRASVAWVLALIRFPMPTVAVAHGACFGGGACLALACDTVFAAADVHFGFVFTQLGLPGGDMAAPWLLSRRADTRTAWRLLSTAAVLEASQAREVGLVDEVLPEDEVLARAREYAGGLAAGPRGALAATKAQILELEGAGSQLDGQVGRQQIAIAEAFGGQEFAEGITAFRQRRPPRF